MPAARLVLEICCCNDRFRFGLFIPVYGHLFRPFPGRKMIFRFVLLSNKYLSFAGKLLLRILYRFQLNLMMLCFWIIHPGKAEYIYTEPEDYKRRCIEWVPVIFIQYLNNAAT